jgi:P-type Mg2+ transporter
MATFGPISSIFDFATFGIMIWVFDAGPTLFRSGWFVESLATQSLVIFAIRMRRVPFFHSRPSRPLIVSTLTCVTIGVLLPFSPLADTLGFTALLAAFMATLVGLVVVYFVLVELAKRRFYRTTAPGRPLARSHRQREPRIHRRASRWSVRSRHTTPRRAGLSHPHPSL